MKINNEKNKDIKNNKDSEDEEPHRVYVLLREGSIQLASTIGFEKYVDAVEKQALLTRRTIISNADFLTKKYNRNYRRRLTSIRPPSPSATTKKKQLVA